MNDVHGKYRGVVTNDRDPRRLGRVQVHVPAVLGDARVWAMPSVPFAGPQVGMLFVPKAGTGVWVEFEGGDTDFPIWSGCYWKPGELPPAAGDPATRVLRTESFLLEVKDGSGGAVTLELVPPAARVLTRVVLAGDGVTITYGTSHIKLTASGVSINDGALEVT